MTYIVSGGTLNSTHSVGYIYIIMSQLLYYDVLYYNRINIMTVIDQSLLTCVYSPKNHTAVIIW